MKDNNAELELLKKQRRGLKKELSAVSDQISKLIETKYLSECTKRYVDTYWVKKSGRNDEDTWSIYTHVTAVKDIWDTEGNGINCYLACNTFRCTNRNEIIILLEDGESCGNLGKQITKSAYEKAKQELLDKLRS
jgi:hypothetical protein